MDSAQAPYDQAVASRSAVIDNSVGRVLEYAVSVPPTGRKTAAEFPGRQPASTAFCADTSSSPPASATARRWAA
jgi:hypothetical protein